MLKRLCTTILAVVAIAGFANVASAQYMFLDANGNGIHDTGDNLNANGTPTTVRIFLDPGRNRDGSTAICNTDAATGLNATSYVVNFAASGGTVAYAGFTNNQANMVTNFGEINVDGINYKNGFGGPLPGIGPAGGPFLLATLTITGATGSPKVDFIDQINGSPDFTSFGTRCDGNGFDSTYKLDGPNTIAYQGASDWFDSDGVGAAAVANTAPVLAAIGNKTATTGVLLSFTATATDADVPAQTLTFTLGAGAPAGATIGGASGVFNWTPAATGTFPVTVIVTDNGAPPLNDSETIQITVGAPVNNPPVLAAIGNRTIAEQTLLSFTATATDPDAGQTRTFTLDAGAPAGAAIAAGGAFTWTPTEAQGPGTFPITVRVTDNGSPAQNDFELIQVTVTEVNVAPILAAIGNRTVAEQTLLSFTATATDADLPANTLTFTLGAGAPAGAAITAGGAFTWTPTEAQGPGSFPITVIVTDNGTPALNDTEAITVTVTEVNVAPILAVIGNRTVAEGALLSFTATATDADVPANTLTFTLGAGAPAGAAITAGGNFTWTPTEAQGGTVSPITVIVTDNGTPALNDTELIQVTVNEVNQAPILATIGNKTGTVGTPVTFTATATDADLPAQTLTFTLGAGAPAGATIGAASGAFSWTPTTTVGSPFPVTVIVTDNGTPPLNDTEAITITVGAQPNTAPVLALIGNKTVAEGSLLSFTATATDSDVPAQTLTFSLGAGNPAGSAITAGGAFTWTPTEAQGPGVFPITVIVTDNGTGNLSDNELIQVTVTEVNVAPILALIGNKTIAEGSLLSFTATATDADVPANTLTFTLGAGAPAGAAITAGGAFTWTPTEAQSGVANITVIVTDNGTPALNDTEAITVTVTEVNQAPVLTAIGNKTVAEGSLLSFTATATDADVPANTLTFTLSAGNPAGSAITAGGAFTWTPTEAQGPGVFPITVNVSDGTATASETIQVTVTEVNVAPILAVIGNRTIAEGALLSFTATATDADVPANTLTFTLGAGAPAGAAITAGGNFTWTPTEAQGGTVSPITVIVTDNGTPALNDTELIQVTVTEVNVAPVLGLIGNKSGTVGVAVTFTATATDADVPAQTLTFSLGAGAPAGATIGAASGAFSWTPTTTVGSPFPVTVIVTDNGTPPLNDTEAITITVSNVPNTAPVLALIGNKTVAEGSLLSFTATATDSDVPAQTLTFSLGAGNPAGSAITAGGAFTWTPTEAQGPGVFPITVIVTDNGTGNLSDNELIQVTVTEVNVAPILAVIGNRTIAEGSLLSFTATATDADVPANTLTFTLGAGAPAGAAITAGGAFTWTPTEAQGPGSFPITVIVTDNGTPALNDTEAITVTVTEVNQAPVLAAIGNKTVAEQTLLSFTATATDADVPANTLTFTLSAGNPAGSAITAGGAFTWTPTEAQGPGVFPITVNVSDGTATASETIQVTVTEVNVAPILAAIGNRTIAEGALLSFTATATDADVPANTLTFTLGAGAPAGAAITAGGNFTFTPSETQGGSVFPITVIVTDNGTPALNDTELIQVTVTEVNVAPVLGLIGNKSGTVGTPVTFTATATDADVPAQTLTFSLGAGAPAGATIGAASGAFSWTPTTTVGSPFPVTVIVTDNGTPPLNDTEAITITVGSQPNTAPVLAAIGNKTVNELALLSFTATATDSDVPAQTLTFSLGAGNPAGSAITAGGNFTWTPTEAQGPGVYPITVIVTDNGTGNLQDSELIQVTVNEVNIAPILAAIGNKTVAEGSLLSFTATATDADVPANTLTFTLSAGNPAGSAITAGGSFTWTPTEAQGPGVFPITVNVSDGTATASETIQVTVTEVNQAPILAAIGNKSGATGVLITFTATATDADVPANTLTFTLGAGAPAGATIGAASGVFNWTPAASGNFPVTVIVTDNGTPALNDTETITIAVGQTNVAPVLAAIGNKTVAEGSLLSFTATATDTPGDVLTFSLEAGAPAGAAITGGGNFTWTPTEAQGPGVYPITVRVTDNGGLFDNETIQVSVTEVNVAPILAAIGNKTGTVGVAVTFTATATDADIPANTLTFTLGAGAPAGATIGAASGAFSWTPTTTVGSPFPVTVIVTDNGTPPLNDTEAITITVGNAPNQPPVLAAIGNKTVNEGSLLSFTATATDPNAGDALTFSLGAGAPAGAAITAGGAFTWTPTEAQGPGVYPITVNVADNGTPVGTDSETIQVTVNEVNIAPVLAQPSDMTVAEGGSATQQLTATDADIPANTLTFTKLSGPTFVTISASGLVTVAPGSSDAGSYPVMARVSDGTANDTKTFNVTVTDVNNAPVADANGPYTGTLSSPVNFDGTGSSDPDGDPLTYAWDFGDASTGSGATTSHTYAAAGTYTVTLTVSDGTLSDSDTSTATIVDQFPADAFFKGNNKIKLNSGKPSYCLQIEPVDGSYNNGDVDLGSIVMTSEGTGSVSSIPALAGKSTVDGDTDFDGIQEIKACFGKEDLRALFSTLGSGNHTVTVGIEGDLITGGRFHSDLVVSVSGSSGGALAANISPNPLNPKATLTFATSKSGMVKVEMYDVQGRLIRTLMNETNAAAGYHDVDIDGHDANGSKLASGIYYVKIQSSVDGAETKAVTILK